MVGEAAKDADIARGSGELKLPTRRWLLATRVSTAPGTTVSRSTGRPVATTARERVVGMPSACIASLTMNSRSIGPTAARPSPPRERRRSRALEMDVAKAAVSPDHLSQQEGASVTETRGELAELVSGVSLRHRSGAAGYEVADQKAQAIEALQPGGFEAQLSRQRIVDHEQSRVETSSACQGRAISASSRAKWSPRMNVCGNATLTPPTVGGRRSAAGPGTAGERPRRGRCSARRSG